MRTSNNMFFAGSNKSQFGWLFLIALTAPFLISACENNNHTLQILDLKEAKDLWEKKEVKTYRVDVERICFCPSPFRYTMKVKNGKIVKILDSENGEPVDANAGHLTIDELFNWLEQITIQKPQKLELEFHPKLGYPTFIDYNQSDYIADEEILMRLKDLQPD